MSIFNDSHFWAFVIGYWVFSAAVGAMPVPYDTDSSWYKFFYTFLHTLSGNITAAFGNKIPGGK
jgi:hypothetical protein